MYPTERQGEMCDSDVVAGVRRPPVARHRRGNRVPTAPKRQRLAPLPRFHSAPFQHHRRDHRTEIQQVCPQTQLRDFRLISESDVSFFLNDFFEPSRRRGRHSSNAFFFLSFFLLNE